MKKVLLCATVAYHFSTFHLPFMAWLQRNGYEVHVASGGKEKLPYTDKQFELPIRRNPFDKENFKAYKELKKLIQTYDYNIIHCHTPVGGVLARLAARSVENQSILYYTAHGFHFCKGAPLKQWMMFYPIERLCARWTDVLVTINEEDYNRAVKHRFPAKEIVHVHGVGVPPAIKKYTGKEVREELELRRDDIVLCYAAEFNKNKNQQLLIKAMKIVLEKHPHVHLLLAGLGDPNQIIQLAEEYGMSKNIHILGYRKDISAVYAASDIAVASSLREGLPVNVMEAMSHKLPVVATKNRGHRELIQGAGILVPLEEGSVFAEAINELIEHPEERKELGRRAYERISEKYCEKVVMEELITLYESKEVLA
ncbi:glycosyltransferase family 4 protein [Alkalicoccus daliensis]|uniref:Glycosyltransferase involved in cell wall bisynthesis n=1 Tax=Alkalicoccus daliensis TaxID=745820 RepID=A0A1G9ZKT0_9BACI|nr:glycosyltransferase family 4 protein [Alkalicoccus daliensis]SDN21717.1 Glycosyltransferase involved in cell wall bisynthesis [Alkalicoccus daliensis]